MRQDGRKPDAKWLRGFSEQESTVRRFIRLPEVLQRVGSSKPTLYRWMQQGKFPRPYPLDDSGHSVGWLLEQVEAWIDQRIAAREANVRLPRAA